MLCSLAIWPIERSVVPPILRTRSAISSVVAKICSDLLVEQQMVIAEMRAADVPVEILGLQVERKRVGQDLIELGRNFAARRLRTDRSAYRGRASPCGAYRGLGLCSRRSPSMHGRENRFLCDLDARCPCDATENRITKFRGGPRAWGGRAGLHKRNRQLRRAAYLAC